MDTLSPRRALAYVRVSTDEQGRSGLGLDAQRHAIEQQVSARGWAPACLVIDDGYSGGSLDRPGISGALDALAAGDADALIVSKLDRLARSTTDVLAVADLAERQGWALVALDIGIDTTTPAGRLVLTMLAALATWERDVIAARTRDALQAAKRQGRRLGAPVKIPERTRARIADLRADGLTLRGIADRLNADDVATVGGGPWWPSTVRGVLRSLALDVEAARAGRAA